MTVETAGLPEIIENGPTEIPPDLSGLGQEYSADGESGEVDPSAAAVPLEPTSALPTGETPAPDPAAPAADPAATSPAAPTAEELASIQEQAKNWSSLSENFGKDPTAFIKNLMSSLTPEQQAQLIPQTQQQVPEAAPLPDMNTEDWQDARLTAPEQFVKRNAAVIHDLPRWAGQTQQSVNQHAQALQQQQQAIQQANGYLGAIGEMVMQMATEAGITMPKIPLNMTADTFKTFQAEVKKAVAVTKAARVQVPTTPTTSGGEVAQRNGNAAIKPGDDLNTIFRKLYPGQK